MSQVFKNAFKATTMIGGASILAYLISAVQNKCAAVFLGPQGIALLGIYRNLGDLIVAISSLGLTQSGVRLLSEAIATDDSSKVSKTTAVFQYLIIATAFLGMIITFISANWIVCWTANRQLHWGEILLLSILVFLIIMGNGINSQLQGRRLIAEMSKVRVYSVCVAIFFVVPCYYFIRINGIILALVFLALVNSVFAWLYARKIPISFIRVPLREFGAISKHMISLGGCVMLGVAITTGCNYIHQTLICQKLSLEANGIFQAAFVLSGMMIQFITLAMSADYFPQLVEIHKRGQNISNAIQEQIELSILLGLPCVAGLMLFAPLAISILYSSAFTDAVLLMRIMAYMMIGRLLSWPIGLVVLAIGSGKTFFFTECIFSLLGVFFIWCGITLGKLNGAAVALSLLQLLYFTVLTVFIFFKYSVKINLEVIYLAVTALFCITVCFLTLLIKNIYLSIGSNVIFLSLICFFCIKRLCFKLDISLSQIMKRFYHG